jgi:predicted lipoprotein with Yx(FWY)xxD motif
MRLISLLLVVVLVILTGCGGDDDGSDAGGSGSAQEATGETTTGKTDATTTRDGAAKATGTTVTLGDSEFGRMLFDSKDQAIYIFERDRKDESHCYGECAEAWPPVFSDGKPRAGKGVVQSLLGTTTRRDGKQQVTYAGKPLYYYAHEGRGEVKCHNVNLNGGFWWAVGADGERLQ